MRSFLSIICVSWLLSCKVNESPVIVSQDDLQPEVVWNLPLRHDTAYSFCMDPLLYDSFIVVTAEPFGSALGSELKLVSLNGLIIFDSESSGSVCNSFAHLEGSGSFIFNDNFIYLCSGRPASIELGTSNILWDYSSDTNTGTKIRQFGAISFYHQRYGGISSYDSSRLYIIDNNTGVREAFFKVGINDGFNPNLYPPEVTINTTGDTILYFQNRQWNFEDSGEGGKVDLYCYNMTADSVVWMAEAIDPYGNSSVCLPLYHEGKVYFRGFRTLHCLDAETGEQMWMHEFMGEFNDLHLGNMLIAEDKLVVKSSDRGIHAFNPESGLLLWERFDTGITSCYMTYYNGSVYFGSYDGELFNVRVSDGKILWAIESPNAGKSPSWEAEFWNGVAIDEENNRIITTDGYYLICLQL